jgi:hypothetical protein
MAPPTEAELEPTDDESHSHPDPKPMTSSGTSSRKKGASREDEEEAKWLEALEAGTLDDDGYLATKGKHSVWQGVALNALSFTWACHA